MHQVKLLEPFIACRSFLVNSLQKYEALKLRTVCARGIFTGLKTI